MIFISFLISIGDAILIFYGIFYDRTLFYTGTNETMYSFLKVMVCSHWVHLLWSLHSFIWISLGWINHSSFIGIPDMATSSHLDQSQVIDGGGPGWWWEEGRVGGVVVAGGDGCRPRGGGDGSRWGWGEESICSWDVGVRGWVAVSWEGAGAPVGIGDMALRCFSSSMASVWCWFLTIKRSHQSSTIGPQL